MRRWLIGIVLVLAVAGGLPLLTLGAGGGPLLQPADYLDPVYHQFLIHMVPILEFHIYQLHKHFLYNILH